MGVSLGQAISLEFQASVDQAIKGIDSLTNSLNGLAGNKAFSDSAMKAAEFSVHVERLGRSLDNVIGPFTDMFAAASDAIAPIKEVVSIAKALYQGLQQINSACDVALGKIKNFASGVWGFEKAVFGTIGKLLGFSDSADDASNSVTGFLSTVKDGITALLGIDIASEVMSNAVTSIGDYTRNIRLFSVSLGQYASESYDFAKNISDTLGIDLSSFVRYQALFNELSTSMGVTSSQAKLMSQNLAQLTYDLGSYLNYDPQEVATKFQNAIGGEARGLRKLGIDISESTLQQLLYAHGIDKTVSSLTASQKAQLRYIAIMEQSSNAMGNFGKTALTPATSLSILKNQVLALSRAVGSTLIPVLSLIVPICVTVVKALTMVFNAIASFLGVGGVGVDFSDTGLSGVADDAEDADSALGGAAGSAKELKKYLAGFDELNVMDSQDSGSGGGGSGSGGGAGGDLGIELPEYDMLSGITKKASDTLAKFFDPFKKAWETKGKDVTDSFKKAVSEIKYMAGLVGKEWDKAWSGRGYAYALSVYRVLEGVFDVVANIVIGFENATKKGVSLSTIFGNFLSLVTKINNTIAKILKTISKVLQESELDDKVWMHILSTINNILIIANNLVTAFQKAWDIGGKPLVEGFLKAAEGITGFYETVSETMVKATTDSSGLVSVFKLLLDFATKLFEAIGLIGQKFTEVWNSTGVGSSIVNGIITLFDTLAGIMSSVANSIKQFWESAAGTGVADAVLQGFNFLVETANKLADAFKYVWEGSGKELLNSLMTLAGEVVRLAETILGTLIGNAANSLKNEAPGIINIIKTVVDMLIQVIHWLNEHPEILNYIIEIVKNMVVGILAVKTAISIIIAAVQLVVGIVIGLLANAFGGIFRFQMAIFETFVLFATSIVEGVKQLKDDIIKYVTDLVGDLPEKVENLKTSVIGKAIAIYEKVRDVFHKVKTTAETVWNGIKDAIANPVETAKNLVKKAIDAIKGFFNFNIQWPHIPMPHFTISPSGWTISDLVKGSIPSLGIDFYAKGGFPGAGQLFMANEAGPELIGNIGSRTAVANNDQIVEAVSIGVARAVSSVLNSSRRSDNSSTGDVILQVDGQTFGRIAINAINRRQKAAGVRLLDV